MNEVARQSPHTVSRAPQTSRASMQATISSLNHLGCTRLIDPGRRSVCLAGLGGDSAQEHVTVHGCRGPDKWPPRPSICWTQPLGVFEMCFDDLKTLERALAPVLVLTLLQLHESYPYQVDKTLRDCGLKTSNHDLGALFQRLERTGYIAPTQIRISAGRARHYFTTTELGQAACQDLHLYALRTMATAADLLRSWMPGCQVTGL